MKRLLLPLVIAGCAARTSAAPSAPPAPAPAPPPAATAAAPADTAAAGFMSGMIAHHAQAIVMSAMVPARGAGRDVRVLAERITVSQRDEIALMQDWLRRHGLRVPDADAPHAAMGHEAHEALMPGMLSAAQLAQLDSARGGDFDRLFLTLMIQHHGGALVMVDQLMRAGSQDPLVFRIASDVHADQTAEIGRMVRMLTILPSAGSEP